MARVTGPLLSMSARGSVGKAITFSAWKGVNVVREWLKPANPQSATQGDARIIMGGLAKACSPILNTGTFYDRVSPLVPGGQSWISHMIQYMRKNICSSTTLYNNMITEVQGHTAYLDWADAADDAQLFDFDLTYAGTADPFEKEAQLYMIAKYGFANHFTTSPFDTALASWTATQIDALVVEMTT